MAAKTALDIAQKEFVELSNVPRDRIKFTTVARLNKQEPRVVRISDSAWPAAIARQQTGGVIDIVVFPDPNLNSPPTYSAVPTASPAHSHHSRPRRPEGSSGYLA